MSDPTNTPAPMTVKELSDYLRLDGQTIYKLIQNHEIPAIKLGHQWRFNRADIDKWLKAKTVEQEPAS